MWIPYKKCTRVFNFFRLSLFSTWTFHFEIESLLSRTVMRWALFSIIWNKNMWKLMCIFSIHFFHRGYFGVITFSIFMSTFCSTFYFNFFVGFFSLYVLYHFYLCWVRVVYGTCSILILYVSHTSDSIKFNISWKWWLALETIHTEFFRKKNWKQLQKWPMNKWWIVINIDVRIIEFYESRRMIRLLIDNSIQLIMSHEMSSLNVQQYECDCLLRLNRTQPNVL